VFQYGFLASAVIAVAVYPPLRMTVLRPTARDIESRVPAPEAVS
jgi:hypothetical protein